jgi:hypothetical protein
MIEGSDNAVDLAERFENALYNTARGWRHAVDRRVNRIVITDAGYRLHAERTKRQPFVNNCWPASNWKNSRI